MIVQFPAQGMIIRVGPFFMAIHAGDLSFTDRAGRAGTGDPVLRGLVTFLTGEILSPPCARPGIRAAVSGWSPGPLLNGITTTAAPVAGTAIGPGGRAVCCEQG